VEELVLRDHKVLLVLLVLLVLKVNLVNLVKTVLTEWMDLHTNIFILEDFLLVMFLLHLMEKIQMIIFQLIQKL
jgi:hypothetical protein